MRTDPDKKAASRSIASEVVAVILIAVAVLVLLSLVTYSAKDASWNSTGPEHSPTNLIGRLGAHLSDALLQLFGLAAFTIPLILVGIALRALFGSGPGLPARKATGSFLLLVALSGLLALLPDMSLRVLANSRNGGLVGYIVEGTLAHAMNATGAGVVLAAVSLLTLMIAMEVSLGSIASIARAAARAAGLELTGSKKSIQVQPEGSLVQREPGPVASFILKLRSWLRLGRAGVRREGRAISGVPSEARGSKYQPSTRPLRQPMPSATAAAGVTAPPGKNLGEVSNELAISSLSEEPYPEAPLNPFGDDDDLPALAGRASRTQDAPGKRTAGSGEGDPRAKGSKKAVVTERRPAPTPPGSNSSDGSDITMDPDVAEMISTASIVRTIEVDGGSVEASGPAITPRTKPKTLKKAAEFGYQLPPLELLETAITHKEQAEEELRERATVLAEKCKEFSVTGHIHRINPGPVVTTFEFKPDPGVKYSRVVSLGDDLCLALKAESIRIDRIPGKSTVGIEVPNAHREKIYLRDVVESAKFQNSESKLTIALGKTINGDEYAADLMKMPHLLIAGATGAGKSVTLNAIICSILYKASPEEVKFIMVDPKRLELGLYEGIPHLLTPIVTEPKRAANALKWATNEMENRYRELAKVGVRNIDQFNQHVRETTHPTLAEDNPDALKPLPYIVITIDELADLMMVARGDVETSIARLAQMARAVGIHLVVATQRPSVDVITGVIKANFPSRIAFRVSSKVDSRTIIDSNGAEGLLGQGDMLFLPPASSRLIRVHGSFVNEAEIKRITDHTRNQAKPDYNEQVTQSEQEVEGFDDALGEQDDLFDDALAIVTDMGRASTSVLQRRLSIGYGRAAKILDLMEKGGFIGPGDGSKPRKVLSAAYEFRDRIQERLEERAE
ncbi:MAG TPA: DNA translocase FtsK [Blastocatellia bacterium]